MKPHITTTHLTVRLKANIVHHLTAVLLIILLPIQNGNTVEKTSVNGQTKTITTGTNKDGKSFVSNDGVTNETSTDDFGRTTQVRTVRSDGTLVFNADYEYANGKAENSTTNLISKFSQSYGGDSVLSYDYSYDNNGNITEIKQNGKLINKYTYDSLNELKEEYDYVNKFYISRILL